MWRMKEEMKKLEELKEMTEVDKRATETTTSIEEPPEEAKPLQETEPTISKESLNEQERRTTEEFIRLNQDYSFLSILKKQEQACNYLPQVKSFLEYQLFKLSTLIKEKESKLERLNYRQQIKREEND